MEDGFVGRWKGVGMLVSRWMDGCFTWLLIRSPGIGKGNFPRKSGPGLET